MWFLEEQWPSDVPAASSRDRERVTTVFTSLGGQRPAASPTPDHVRPSIGLPRRIITTEPTAGFWATQTDAGKLGAHYDVIDPLLYRFVEEGHPLEDAVTGLRIDHETAAEITSRYAKAAQNERFHRRRDSPDAAIRVPGSTNYPPSAHVGHGTPS